MDRDRYEVELDGELLDVLASDTRRGILQSLADRRRTLSELSRDLDRNKSTIHEHMGRLSEAGLVERDENGERKWTYYELTDEGRRIVEPDDTRVRLVIGAAVVGLVAGALAVAAVAGFSGMVPTFADQPAEGPQASSPDSGAVTDTVTIQATDTTALSESGTTLRGTVSGAEELDGPVRAYLVPENETDELQAGTPSTGVEVDAALEGENLTVELPGPVEPGDYRLYVIVGDRHANVTDLPRIRLRDSLAELSTTTFYRGFSDPVELRRTSDLVPEDATVFLRPASGGTRAAAVDLSEGRTNLTTSLLDDLPDGTYRFRAVPDDGAPVPLGLRLEVETPNVVVAPQVVREDLPVDLRIHVQPSEAWAGEPAVRVDGAEREPAVVDRDTRGLRVEPTEAGDLPVEVGRLARETVEVQPQIDASLTVVDGPAWEVDVRNETGDPAPGVDVRIDGRYRASTNASGEARIDIPEDGEHVLTLVGTSGEAVDVPVDVSGWDAHVLDPSLTLSAQATSPEPGRVNVSVEAANGQPAPLAGTLVAQVGDDVAGVGTVKVPGNGSSQEEMAVRNASGGELDVTVVASSPQTPGLAVRNDTSSDDGGVGAAGGDAGTADGLGTVDAGSASTQVTVSAVGTFESALDGDGRLGQVPIPGAADEDDAAAGGTTEGEGAAVPVSPAALQAAAVAAAAVALARGNRRGRS